ncbi:MAG: amidohydrolase, partial [Acidobacteria bacterium]|nr:amidohydrolase [Acidobacteriota bacterium]
KGKHVYPGFILPVTNLGLTEIGAVKATKDDAETGLINPNIRSISAYNTDSEITPTLRFNGILLAQVTPQGGLVSGLSSIVQLDAWNWEDATVVADDALHINWPNHVQNRFDFSTFTMKKEENKEFQTQVNSIKSLFIDAKNTANSKSQSDNLKLKAVEPVFTSSRKVYVHTDNPV